MGRHEELEGLAALELQGSSRTTLTVAGVLLSCSAKPPEALAVQEQQLTVGTIC